MESGRLRGWEVEKLKEKESGRSTGGLKVAEEENEEAVRLLLHRVAW